MKKDTVIIIGIGDIGKTAIDYLKEKERGVIIVNEPEPILFKAQPKIDIVQVERLSSNFKHKNKYSKKFNHYD